MRAKSEKNQKFLNNKAFLEDMPSVCAGNRLPVDKNGQESKLFADKWFHKEELIVRVKL